VARWGIDEDIRNPIVLNGDGTMALPITLAFERREGRVAIPGTKPSNVTASALILKPQIGCTKAVLDIHPGKNIVADWVVISPIGLRVFQGMGGQKVSPGYLLDSLPQVIALPKEKDTSGTPISRLPSKAVVTFKHPYVQAQFSPRPTIMDGEGVTLQAGLDISARDTAESDSEKTIRSQVRKSIAEDIPSGNCDTSNEIWVTGGDIQILNVTKEVKYIVDSAKRKIKIAESAWKAAGDLTKGKPEELLKLPEQAFADHVEDIKHGLDVLRNPPTVPIPNAPSVTLPGGGPTITPTVPTIPTPSQPIPGVHIHW
jgi:hypothetical protein